MSKYVCSIVREYHYKVEVETDNISNAENIAKEKIFVGLPLYTQTQIRVSVKGEDKKFNGYQEGGER
jgi:hypothetical protein